MKNTSSSSNENTRLSIPLNKRVLKYTFVIAVIAVLAYVLIAQPQQLMSFVNGFVSIFTPLIIGLCVAYVVNLILRPLERFWLWIWHKCKRQKLIDAIKRPLCLILAFLIFLSMLAALVFMVIPEIKDTVDDFDIKKYSVSDKEWFKKTEAFLEKYYFDEEKEEQKPDNTVAYCGECGTAIVTDNKFCTKCGAEVPPVNSNTETTDQTGENHKDSKTDANSVILGGLVKSWSKVLDTTVAVTAAIVTAVVNIILGFAIAVYLLAQKEKFKGQVGKVINAIFEPARAKKVKRVASLTNNTFTNFITGQLTESCILGILCFIGMTIFKMPNPGIISILVAVTALIPIFGAFIGTGIGAFLILFDSPIKAIWFVIFLIILQQIESNVIYPRVVGQSVGLPSVWVLVAVTIGGRLFGVIGMLFSVPLCSVAYVLLREYVNKKNKQSTENICDEDDSADSQQE